MTRPSLAAIFLLCFSSLSLAQQQCFLPNGKLSPGDFPCDPDAEDSMCCPGEQGMVCLTNKLCGRLNEPPSQSACTNRFWRVSECAMFCPSPIESPGIRALVSCANATGTDTSYCCGEHPAACCDGGVGRFDAPPSRPEVLATWDVGLGQFVRVGAAASPPGNSRTGPRPPAPQSTVVTGAAAAAGRAGSATGRLVVAAAGLFFSAALYFV